jgi:hypothetical protein
MFFSRKKHKKELQKAARCAVIFYVAMFQQIISELARLFDTERCSFLMVYPLGVDVFSRKKHKKEPQKAARCAVVFYVVMFQQINSGHKIGALFYQQKTRCIEEKCFLLIIRRLQSVK